MPVFSNTVRPILSPCTGICRLAADGLCEGCHRTADEIAHWIDYTDEQRSRLMNEVLPQRARPHVGGMNILEQRLVRAVRALDDPPGSRGWNHEDLSDILEARERAAAAVLVPLVARSDGFSVLLTRRTEHLTAHGGQVSFPGGRMEAGDADAIAAALRETREEVGIGAELLRPFGYLDSLETVSGFWVTPVVAWLDASYRAQPDPNEVAHVFEVPLDFFLATGNLRELRLNFRGRPREVFEFAHATERIWGATAAMLLNLVRRLEAVA